MPCIFLFYLCKPCFPPRIKMLQLLVSFWAPQVYIQLEAKNDSFVFSFCCKCADCEIFLSNNSKYCIVGRIIRSCKVCLKAYFFYMHVLSEHWQTVYIFLSFLALNNITIHLWDFLFCSTFSTSCQVTFQSLLPIVSISTLIYLSTARKHLVSLMV